MRRVISFACAGETLFGTLDEGSGRTGLLIVSGGNEIRIGAHRGMALLSQRLAAEGIPVFRFDRRGIGDSTGENGGFRSSAPDIAAAAATFTAETGVERLVALGNCDAATALALFGHCAGIDRLILANPWVVEERDDLPPAAAIRARYVERLLDPGAWLRMARGGVDLRKLALGLSKIATPAASDSTGLARDMMDALARWKGRASVLLARRDNTAIAFLEASSARLEIPVDLLDSASHSFAGTSDADWLFERVQSAIAAA